MILRVEGGINKYYVQTLCMVFFPGSTFGENEQPGPDVPEVFVSVYSDDDYEPAFGNDNPFMEDSGEIAPQVSQEPKQNVPTISNSK